MIDLKNKKILITGASSGIGRSVAILCDELGAETIITGRNEEELNNTHLLLKNRSKQLTADLSKEDSINELLSKIPSIDGFVHCAGIINPLPVKFIKKKHIDDIFMINFSSAVLLSSGLLSLKKINPQASVVFISSVSAHHPYTGGSLYTSSKAALEAFTRGFALEASAKKIRVNIIAPALVRTNILEQSEQIYSKEEIAEIENRYPFGIGEPIDIANAIAFLLSPLSGWITGTTLNMDGGLLLNSK
ncbi:MAG: family oxidoreductase [Bacteroidetes bacterium]|jgi:NAD(P)-dependent dehydrogenase (short-subunit alcohol dehydrogenase family)|nr:family oxidoreductase [Bacteroidota bacterium]